MRRIAMTMAALALAGWIGGAPAAAEEFEGTGLILEVDLAGSALVIKGEVYHVDGDTRLEDAQGGELTLAQMPSLAGGASGDEVAAWFVADEARAGGMPALRQLRLTGAMPK